MRRLIYPDKLETGHPSNREDTDYADQSPYRIRDLFEELCRQHGVKITRLPVCSDSQQPDYELVLASGQKVIAEVKQIVPNENDVVPLKI